jgi:hypothetical protein
VDRILTAPDNSALTIFQNGQRSGLCNWVTSAGEAWANVEDESGPAGMARLRNYNIRLDGNTTLAKYTTNTLRFEASLGLSREKEWQDARIRLSVRPVALEARSIATNRSVRLLVEDGEFRYGRTFTFSELQKPNALALRLIGPFGEELAALIESAGTSEQNVAQTIGLKWEARDDVVRIGGAQVRGYRLQTRLLDRYPVTIYVSRVGEILRVELPGQITLVNELPPVL